jgi:ferrous-iron efflux pump FieF
MDHELPAHEREAIEQIATATPNVIGIHDLRTWQTGNKKVIQMHIELDDRISLLQAHDITNTVEKRILTLEPLADIIIHQDPVNVHTNT